MLRVVFCFMSANMRAHMCLIRQGRCGGEGGRAYIEFNWRTSAALLRVCTACKRSSNFYERFNFKRFVLQNRYRRSLMV
jgi:hypothetical protein